MKIFGYSNYSISGALICVVVSTFCFADDVNSSSVTAESYGVCRSPEERGRNTNFSEYLMVALGDSVTTAFNSYSYGNQPELSWATGSDIQVNSHFLRLSNLMPEANIIAFNGAEAGAETRNLAKQISEIPGKPDYVTLFMGGNDACDWGGDSESLYSEVATNIENSIKYLIEMNKNVKILLVPIPDIYQTWEIGHNSMSCRFVWNISGMCRNLFGRNLSDSDRLLFRERVQEINRQLLIVADNYKDNVRYDIDLGSVAFESDEISSLDCFHPSVIGQEKIARLSWENGWFVD